MLVRGLMLLLWLPYMITAASIQRRDADFASVRTRLLKDMSGRAGDPTEKYFRRSLAAIAHGSLMLSLLTTMDSFHAHYDGRFAEQALGYRARKVALHNLIQTYLATFADLGVETWLAHGTLLGWWWNRQALPWDSDSDVHINEAAIDYLALYYNMSTFHYRTPRIPEGRDYLIEVNPRYVIHDRGDKLNKIDARYIDTVSGLFIDITTARYNASHPRGPDMLVCKDGHEYRDTQVFPLRDTYFEGVPAKIPYAYKEILEAEYKSRALTNPEFAHHRFDAEKLEWIPVQAKSPIMVTVKKAPATQPEHPPSSVKKQGP